VLWGPGASAGTILFERQPPIFDRAEAKGHISGLIGSRNRQDGNLAVSLEISKVICV